MTFSNVGASLFDVMASISASCSDMPRSIAGRKCSGSILSKGGTPYGVSHSAKKGFSPTVFPDLQDMNVIARKSVNKAVIRFIDRVILVTLSRIIRQS